MSMRTPIFLTAVAVAILALSGCSDEAMPLPEETQLGGGGISTDGESTTGGGEAGGATDPFEQARADGLPDLALTGCPQLDDYEYSPSTDRQFWHFTFTCVDRTAYDATAADVAASGYEPDSLVISEGTNVSERNLLVADANGGYTEVQLSLVGTDDELEFEIYVTITTP